MHNSSIGRQLRIMRRNRSLTLKEVAAAAGCSESMLSKIETGKALPSLPTLHKIVTALGTSISMLIPVDGSPKVHITQPGTRQHLNMSAIGLKAVPGIHLEIIANNGMHLFSSIHNIEPNSDSGGVIAHDGEEICYVLEGEIVLTVSECEYLMTEGSSATFSSSLPHRYRNDSDKLARILWTNSPPSF